MHVLGWFLLLVLSNAFAKDFGGIKFHSEIPAEQSDLLVNDIRYLFENPITKADSEFLLISEINNGTGPELHNWLVNRVKYVVGEKYDFTKNVQIKLFHKFPKTPLPPSIVEMGFLAPKTVMSNIGGALYLGGKSKKILLGTKFDKEKIFAKSSRVGLIQIGEGLFFEGFQISPESKSPANSIARLSTFFHEARHSDGSGVYTGFVHATCPPNHSYAGFFACEEVGNGPYSIGGLTERHLLKNCSECSVTELTMLEAYSLDSLGRVINLDLSAKIKSIKDLISTYISVANSFQSLLPHAQTEEKKLELATEILKMNELIAGLEKELAKLKTGSRPAQIVSPKPEGDYKELKLEESIKLMKASLNPKKVVPTRQAKRLAKATSPKKFLERASR